MSRYHFFAMYMKRIKEFLILIWIGLLPLDLMADGNSPNALMVHLKTGSVVSFWLDSTRLLLMPSINQVRIDTGSENSTFTLSDVKCVVYEYQDPSSVTASRISMNDIANIEVYTYGGGKIISEKSSLRNIVNKLAHGVYVIKVNGRTLKIVK